MIVNVSNYFDEYNVIIINRNDGQNYDDKTQILIM